MSIRSRRSTATNIAMAGWPPKTPRKARKTIYSFSTGARAGLGDQLPAGILRFYMRDKRGDPQFIGESRIEHTPMGSTLIAVDGRCV